MFGPTVQGEGSVIGQQTYFLRFGLCDYACKMCDSMHAVDPEQVRANAQWLSQPEIADGFFKFHKPSATRWLTFSGGNPCIHDLEYLVDALHVNEFKIHVETQGTFCPDWLLEADSVCVSPKTPGMGEKLELDKLDAFTYRMQHLISGQFSFKMVVFDQRDLEIASMIYERYVLTGLFDPSQFYLSLGNPWPPGTDFSWSPSDNPQDSLPEALLRRYESLLADVMQDKNLSNVKFLPQMHVLVWGNKQGV